MACRRIGGRASSTVFVRMVSSTRVACSASMGRPWPISPSRSSDHQMRRNSRAGCHTLTSPCMTAEDIRAMVRAGMTIGFHTLHHPVLSTLAEGPLESALTEGRRELAAAAGAPVDLLAYPHGRATAAVADAAERAAFTAAFAPEVGPSRRPVIGSCSTAGSQVRSALTSSARQWRCGSCVRRPAPTQSDENVCSGTRQRQS